MKKTVFRVLILLVGVVLVINALFMSVMSNINAGIIAELALGLVLLLYSVFVGKFVPKIPKWIRAVFWCGVSVVTVFAVFLYSYGVSDNISGSEDAVIVLGSGIRGELLTVGLKNRLDCAVECYEDNPDTVIVVSGGQGPQEDITEALAMERYLLRCGVPEEKIIKEEQATSTYENFVYSKQLLDDKFGADYSVAYVTNDYHVYRAGSLARVSGLENVTHAHSSTMWYTVIPSCMRECMAVVKMWIFNK
ncbi:MAG: YdcF family protein [Clostridia bacterium]|nr:YdcF family protein [Clostridia bacterium]